MPSQWTKVELPLGGIDAYTDAPHVQPGKLLYVENARFRKPGSLTKRDGFAAMATTLVGNATSHGDPMRVVQHNDEMLLATERGIHAYSFAGADRWTDAGPSPKYHARRISVARPSVGTPPEGVVASQLYYTGDVALANTVAAVPVVVDIGGGLLRCDVHIVEVASGTVIDVHTLASNPTALWLLTDDTSIFVIYNSTANGLDYEAFHTSTLVWTAAASITTTAVVNTGVMTWERVHGAAEFIMAAKITANNNISVEIFNTSFVSQRVQTITTGAGTPEDPIAVYATAAEDVYVLYDNGTDLRVWSATTAGLVQNYADQTVLTVRADAIAMTRRNSSSVWFVFDYDNAGVRTLRYGWGDDGVGGAVAAAIPNLYIASDPWIHDTKPSILVAYDASDAAADPSYFIYEIGDIALAPLTEPVLLGTIARTTGVDAVSLGTSSGNVSSRAKAVINVGNTGVLFGIGITVTTDFKALADRTFKTGSVGVDLLMIDAVSSIYSDNRFLSAPWGRSRVFAGAQPMIYDGVRTTDQGHQNRPEAPTWALTASSPGAAAANSIVKMILVWEWQNAAGQIERSAPSKEFAVDPSSITGSLRYTVSLSIPDVLLPGNRPADSIRAGVYLTDANGSLYYQIGVGMAGDANIIFETSRAILLTSEPLYTDGGIFPNIGAPACTHIVEHRERLFACGLDGDAEGIAFTKPHKLGVAPEWVADAFVIRIPGAGRITALASLDTALIAFSATDCWAIFGDGPPDTTSSGGDAPGGIAGFSVQRITADVGCANPRSLVVTPQGLMFEAKKGIYRIDRSLQSMWGAGAQANRLVELYGPVTGATLRAGTTEVEFGLTASADVGRKLVYDYSADAWAIDTLGAGIPSQVRSIAEYSGAASIVAVVPRIFIAGDTKCYLETPLAYADGGESYSMKLQTMPIAIGTNGGHQRIESVTIMGERVSSHSLTIKWAYDSDVQFDAASYSNTTTRAASEVLNGYPQKLDSPRQKCRNVRVEIAESASSIAGESARWHALVLNVAPKVGTAKLPATQRE